ncbi:MAG: helicase, partial [Verrucomicrobiaceae bacterium]
MAKNPSKPPVSPLGKFVASTSAGSKTATIPSSLPPANAHREALRRELVGMLSRDLLGPSGGPYEELLARETPRSRYLVGLLAPQDVGVLADELEPVAAAGADSSEEGVAEADGPSIDSMFPSSMGVTFVVDSSAQAIVVRVAYGRYEHRESANQTTKTGSAARTWHRVPVAAESPALPLKPGDLPRWKPEPGREIEVTGRVRDRHGVRTVTVFLANRQEELRPKDVWWLFQPQMEIISSDGSAIFTKRQTRTHDASKLDPLHAREQATLTMLYRRRLEFAVGHGVSIHPTVDPANPLRATKLETRYIPEATVLKVDTPDERDNPSLTGLIFDMKEMAELPAASLNVNLKRLGDAYAEWIDWEEAKLAVPAEELADHQNAARDTIAGCRKSLSRLRAGIDLLKRDPQALEAFRFANLTMATQRVRGIYARQTRKGGERGPEALAKLDVRRNRSWRAFQLAFVLINLPGLTDPHHPERSSEAEAMTDLLWFPTGGGKTEAYLGLAAYVLATRRIQGVVEGYSGEHGLAVLMRYTLRLLTLQQFQRAATLMCACEEIRQADPKKWGKSPFRIGLYVGAKTTPNTTNMADESIRMGGGGGWGTPAQLTSCPWCGCAISPDKHIRVYKAPSDIGRTVIYCGDPLGTCPFSERKAKREGLPVMVVDEEIYRNPPSILVATVDKFAQLPWKGELQMLFGQVNGWCSRHGFLSPEIDDRANHLANADAGLPASWIEPHHSLRPPDLIIQDELHLISGPLGS